MTAQQAPTLNSNSTIDPREFRNTMGRFATGVTIVTTELNGEVRGMTANAFMSVSLDPPLVVVSVDSRSNLHKMLSQSMRFGVSILAEDQHHLSGHFAGKSVEGLEVKFTRMQEMSLIHDAVAHIVARVVDAHRAGDHTLYIGQVEHIEYRDDSDDKPLLFYAGHYRQLQPLD